MEHRKTPAKEGDGKQRLNGLGGDMQGGKRPMFQEGTARRGLEVRRHLGYWEGGEKAESGGKKVEQGVNAETRENRGQHDLHCEERREHPMCSKEDQREDWCVSVVLRIRGFWSKGT